MRKIGQLILVGTKLLSSQILEGDKKETERQTFMLVTAHKTRLIRAVGEKKRMFSVNLGSFYSQLLFWKPGLSVSFLKPWRTLSAENIMVFFVLL